MADTSLQTSSLKKKEDIFRNGFTLTLLVGFGLIIAYFVLPYLAAILANLALCGVLALGIAGVVYVLLDKQMRTIWKAYYRSMTRWLAGQVVDLDPIGILQNRVEDGRARSEHFREQIDNLSGQLKNVEKQIKAYKAEAEEATNLANAAKGRPGMENTFLLQSRQYKRLDDSAKQLQELVDKMRGVEKVLKKFKEYTDFVVTDTDNTVKLQRKQRDMMKSGWSATKDAQALIAGESTEREMFDMAMEKLAVDYDTKMAAIENFAEESKGLFDTFDLRNEAAAASMLSRLEGLEKKGEGLTTQPPRVALRVDTSNPPEAASADSMDDLFNDHQNSARR